MQVDLHCISNQETRWQLRSLHQYEAFTRPLYIVLVQLAIHVHPERLLNVSPITVCVCVCYPPRGTLFRWNVPNTQVRIDFTTSF